MGDKVDYIEWIAVALISIFVYSALAFVIEAISPSINGAAGKFAPAVALLLTAIIGIIGIKMHRGIEDVPKSLVIAVVALALLSIIKLFVDWSWLVFAGEMSLTGFLLALSCVWLANAVYQKF